MPSFPSDFLPKTTCSPLVVQVLQTKVARLKELLMFLEDTESEMVLANFILASYSLANEPIGL